MTTLGELLGKSRTESCADSSNLTLADWAWVEARVIEQRERQLRHEWETVRTSSREEQLAWAERAMKSGRTGSTISLGDLANFLASSEGRKLWAQRHVIPVDEVAGSDAITLRDVAGDVALDAPRKVIPWLALVQELARRYGWTPAEMGGLTLGQALAMLSKPAGPTQVRLSPPAAQHFLREHANQRRERAERLLAELERRE